MLGTGELVGDVTGQCTPPSNLPTAHASCFAQATQPCHAVAAAEKDDGDEEAAGTDVEEAGVADTTLVMDDDDTVVDEEEDQQVRPGNLQKGTRPPTSLPPSLPPRGAINAILEGRLAMRVWLVK